MSAPLSFRYCFLTLLIGAGLLACAAAASGKPRTIVIKTTMTSAIARPHSYTIGSIQAIDHEFSGKIASPKAVCLSRRVISLVNSENGVAVQGPTIRTNAAGEWGPVEVRNVSRENQVHYMAVAKRAPLSPTMACKQASKRVTVAH